MGNDLKAVFAGIHVASRKNRIPNAEMRRRRLASLKQLVVENRDEIARAIDADFAGRACEETELLEIVPLLAAIRHALRSVRRWM